jgi:flagellar biosynthesis GTPase FlhF
VPGLINVDFADVRTIMSNMGRALMGSGASTGKRRAVEAAEMAISSPLLEDVSIEGATGILINITGGPDLTLHEVNEASTLIQEAAHEDANIIFGSVIDANVGDEVRITVIATGFDRSGTASRTTAQPTTAPVSVPVTAAVRAPARSIVPTQVTESREMQEAREREARETREREAREAREREVREAREAREREVREARERQAREAREAREREVREAREAREREAREVRAAEEPVKLTRPRAATTGQFAALYAEEHAEVTSEICYVEEEICDNVERALDELGDDTPVTMPSVRAPTNPAIPSRTRTVAQRPATTPPDASAARRPRATQTPAPAPAETDAAAAGRRRAAEFPRVHPSLRHVLAPEGEGENELDVPTFIRRHGTQTPSR